jgi:bacteriocin-like protein
MEELDDDELSRVVGGGDEDELYMRSIEESIEELGSTLKHLGRDLGEDFTAEDDDELANERELVYKLANDKIIKWKMGFNF